MPLTEESRFLSFAGMRIHFRLVRPDIPTRSHMMLLSSPMTTSFHWRKLLPELAGMGCLAVLAELPGFGRCDPEAPQDSDTRAKLLWGVLDDVDRTLGTPMSMWHLGAHGTACGTILKMASLYPDSVRSQIHFSPLFSVAPSFRRAEVRQNWYDETVLDARAFHRTIEKWSGFPMDSYIVDRMRAPLLRPGMRNTFGRMLQASLAPPRQGMGFCPTMVLLGGRDPLMSEGPTRQMHALLGDAEFHRLNTAGHFPMETHSKALRDYLRGWLKYNA